MHLTRHASARIQQRSVPRFIVQLLLDHVAREHDHRGAIICFFDKRSRRRVAAELGHAIFRRLDRHLFDAYAVVADDGEVLTVGYRTQRILRGLGPQTVRLPHSYARREPVRVRPAPVPAGAESRA